jgi:tetratricopeptide (TPR) repeat protein
MKMKSLFILFYFTLISSLAFANQTLLKEANNALRNEQYEEAITKYEELIKSQSIVSAQVLNNLACAYYQVTDYPNAILFFERALRLDPANKTIEKNIEISNLHIEDKLDIVPEMFYTKWIHSLYKLLTVNGWFSLFVILFVLFFVSLSAYMFAKPIGFRKIGLYSTFVFLPFTIIVLAVSLGAYKRTINKNEAIIMSERVALKNSPNEKSSDSGIIHAGLKVKIKDNISRWYLVKLPDGKEGWIQNTDFEII